jgi:hypothetical protein
MFRRTTELDISFDDGLLVIDGTVLEDVLAEVYRRFGPDAQILAAERNVVGGLGGFFGTERFHVVSRPADGEDGEADVPAERPTEPVDGPSFAAALAEALSGELEREAELPEPATPEVASPDRPAPLPVMVPVQAPAAPVIPLPQPAPAASPQEWPIAPAAVAPVLQPPPWPAHAAGSVLRAPASPPAWPPSRPPAPNGTGPSWSLPPMAPVERRVPALPPLVEPTAAPRQLVPDAAGVFDAVAALPTPPFTPEPTVVPDVDELLTFAELPLNDLLDRMDQVVPEPSRTAPPGVVAIVGDTEDAVTTVGRLAARQGTSGSSAVVLLAPDLRSRDSSRVVITSLTLIDEQRRRWSQRAGTTFVAVALDPGDAGRAWAHEALRVLAPAQVRYAAPAWRSNDELRERVAAIGHVDCVDLVDLEQALEPAEFLMLNPPIATIQGRPASAELWAAHLLATRRASVDTRRDLGGIG